jgi:hypothetical protein
VAGAPVDAFAIGFPQSGSEREEQVSPMKVTHLEASNWRNFKNVGFDVGERLFVVGPNAAGKSNLLDIFRFLADIAGRGGGLASAIDRRGGLKKVRSLFSRNNAGGRLVIDVTLRDGDTHGGTGSPSRARGRAETVPSSTRSWS